MRRWIALSLLLPVCAVLAGAGETRFHNNAISAADDSRSDDCAEQLHVYNDDYSARVRDEEVRTVANQPLTITAEHNGGIQVTNWDKPEISLKLCKQAAATDQATARKVLAETKLEISGNNVSVRSPERADDVSLGTLLLVKAPKGATLNLTVHNGGISVHGFNGVVKAHAQNGGISLKNSSGTLAAEAQNGGITIKDCAGDVTANLQNGGLSISLPERWEGKGLDAHTHNGGLVVTVPRNLATGVEIATSQYTSIVCKGEVCNEAQRTWDDDGRKLLRLGTGTAQVHATTTNGGVVIKAREHSRGEL